MASEQDRKAGILYQWVDACLRARSNITVNSVLKLTPLAGDAGFRQYFSVNSCPPLLAVMAPITPGVSESAVYFASLADALRDQGVPTPCVLDYDRENNFLLIEHFGDRELLGELSPNSVDMLYAEAILVLLRLQQIPRSALSLGDYDNKLLRQEMMLCDRWFIKELLGHTLSVAEQQLINSMFDFLVEQALSQPQVLVHRDYHSRNLIYRDAEAPGVIDFQDAVWGPVTYDLVSLLRDCYIRWPVEQVRQWVRGYGSMAYELGIIPETSEEQLWQWFGSMGLQRHIKVLGIFARLSLRDRKHQYLQDLPLVIHYVLEAAHQYPQTQEFAHWFEQTLLPQAKKQPWYRLDAAVGECL